MGFGIPYALWIILLFFNCKTRGFSGDEILTSQSGGSGVESTGYTEWTPSLNVSCSAKNLVLGENPGCVRETLTQKSCPDGVFKKPSDRGRACIERVIDCTADVACEEWGKWAKKSNCCASDTCEYEGFTFRNERAAWKRERTCRRNTGDTCKYEYRERKCIVSRAGPGGQFGDEDSEGGIVSSSSLQTIAFVLVGTVLVGVLLFTAVRITIAERRDWGKAVDNKASGSLVFSRTTSQLSTIAEESAEDALSHITVGTEPAEDDCFFKYDSDAINELDNEQSDCAFEENPKPASSSEAINYINDVIAMHAVENDLDGIEEAPLRFRTSEKC